MQDEIEIPETLHNAISYFAKTGIAHRIISEKRWPNGAECPHCNSHNHLFMEKRERWQCRDCRKQFTVKAGTIFEDSPIKLDKWLCAFWLITNAKNGISSCELHRSIGVTQKTAWFMLHRIRLAIQNGSIVKMNGTCEADETYIGAKARFMHKAKRHAKGHAGKQKTAVQGILERTTAKKASRVVLKVVSNTRKTELCGNVRKYVLAGSTVCTDALMSYDDLQSDFDRKVIDHAISYADGAVHTNGLENFWSLLKRAIRGTYVSVEPFHLFRYLDEQAFRFNERKNKDGDRGRFMLALDGIFGKGLRYATLIGKNLNADGLPEATA